MNYFLFYSGGKGSQNSVDALGNSLHGENNGTAVREFLWQHIELAHSKGFDDNVGRNPPLAVFEASCITMTFQNSFLLRYCNRTCCGRSGQWVEMIGQIFCCN